jgi:hypothetical protein|tara:strand:- start:9 stop:320 length:312 start_codon:yes stop_codon:yes gene_type:complete
MKKKRKKHDAFKNIRRSEYFCHCFLITIDNKVYIHKDIRTKFAIFDDDMYDIYMEDFVKYQLTICLNEKGISPHSIEMEKLGIWEYDRLKEDGTKTFVSWCAN